MTTGKRREKGITVTRLFDIPRDRVWKAWTEPEHIMRWWGPKDFTSPACKVDLQVGGKHLFCMRDTAGRDYWSTGVYREIVPLKKLVYIDSFADEKGNIVPASYYGMPGNLPMEMLVTVTFEDAGEKTKMVLHHEGMKSGKTSKDMKAGWDQSFDKLADRMKSGEQEQSIITKDMRARLVAEPGKQEVVIERTFGTVRECIFRAFADPTMITGWWGPRRMTTIVERMDVKPGGIWRFINRDIDGKEYGFHGVFHEIVAPERLVSTFEYEGMPGHVVLESVLLEEHIEQYVYGFDARTRMTVKDVFQSVEDRDEMMRSGMEEGVRDSFERLDRLAARLCIRKRAA